ncbi:hypothetical protein PHMEG_0002186 [Phytophthora megakarya]|uniref:Uncharacterized protein n=1 Tax=Phytophthora megakarya TaxID=4795 RepID=A0A225X179_9STRA|nr:hypothetical protein PHMEG_0002186 [Phytophthora megakarya]
MTHPLPACTGFFMRSHCTHPQLFEEEYKRYCGSSLEVVLRFDLESDVAQPFDVTNVFVFARFETVDSKNLSGTYSLSYLRSISQSEVNTEASWIEGVRQTMKDRQQHSQQLQGQQPARSSVSYEMNQSATFVLNGQTYAKWYYHWESGANKVQRATKHALKAYVFFQTQPQDSLQESSTDITLELLCVVTSPPFTVVSYRRAPLDASMSFVGSPDTLALDAAASMIPHYETDTVHPVDSRLRRLVQNQISRAFQEYNMTQLPHHQQGDMSLHDEKDEEHQSRSDRDPFDRYRQLQEREGLRFRLLTPEDTASSGSSLHNSKPSEQRLVFDSARRRDDRQLWHSTNKDDDAEIVDENDGDDIRDEAVPCRKWKTQVIPGHEVTVSGPVGIPPPSIDPGRQNENPTNTALLRFQQQQLQIDSHQRELQQLTDLAIIHFFVSHVTTNNCRTFVGLEMVVTKSISRYWRYTSGDATHLAKLILSIANNELGEGSQRTTTSRNKTERSLTDTKLEELMGILIEMCVWVFSPESIDLVQNLLAGCHPLLLESLKSIGSGTIEDDGKELRAAFLDSFLDCVGKYWNALNEFLQTPRVTKTTIHNVRKLSDAILGVVFSDPELEELRSGLRTMLQRPTVVLEDSKDNTSVGPDAIIPRCNLAGWHGFLAQVREGYLVQAEPSVLSSDNAWLRLICDGRVRVAPVAPNGLTSLMGGDSCGFGGDYIAYQQTSTIHSDGNNQRSTSVSDQNSICVEFYWWSQYKTQEEAQNPHVAYRSVLAMKTITNGAFMEAKMNLQRGFVDHQTIAAAAYPNLELWTPNERVQAVTSWNPWLTIQGVYARGS